MWKCLFSLTVNNRSNKELKTAEELAKLFLLIKLLLLLRPNDDDVQPNGSSLFVVIMLAVNAKKMWRYTYGVRMMTCRNATSISLEKEAR